MEDRAEQRSDRQIKAWIGQNHVIYGSLIAGGLLMLQPFLFKGEASGMAAKICVISFDSYPWRTVTTQLRRRLSSTYSQLSHDECDENHRWKRCYARVCFRILAHQRSCWHVCAYRRSSRNNRIHSRLQKTVQLSRKERKIFLARIQKTVPIGVS